MLFSLLKEPEDENMERVIHIKCVVQSDVFQGGEVSDLLYCFPIYKNKLEKGATWG